MNPCSEEHDIWRRMLRSVAKKKLLLWRSGLQFGMNQAVLFRHLIWSIVLLQNGSCPPHLVTAQPGMKSQRIHHRKPDDPTVG